MTTATVMDRFARARPWALRAQNGPHAVARGVTFLCWLAALVGLGAVMVPSGAMAQGGGAPTIQLPPDLDPDEAIFIETPHGPVIIKLMPDKAPNHVERLKTLTRSGFYNGVPFHRVIDGFMAQTGDPTGTGRGGSPLPDLEAEFNDTRHKRGTVSMARASDPDSANSQFFIMTSAAPYLDGQYTAFGEVVVGIEAVDRLAKGEPPALPDRMLRVMILSDVFRAMGMDPTEMAPPPPIPDDLDIVSPVLIDPSVLDRDPASESPSEGESSQSAASGDAPAN